MDLHGKSERPHIHRRGNQRWPSILATLGTKLPQCGGSKLWDHQFGGDSEPAQADRTLHQWPARRERGIQPCAAECFRICETKGGGNFRSHPSSVWKARTMHIDLLSWGKVATHQGRRNQHGRFLCYHAQSTDQGSTWSQFKIHTQQNPQGTTRGIWLHHRGTAAWKPQRCGRKTPSILQCDCADHHRHPTGRPLHRVHL